MTEMRHIPQEELVLHAMQALPSEEAAAVRLHLSKCATAGIIWRRSPVTLRWWPWASTSIRCPRVLGSDSWLASAASALKAPTEKSGRVVSISQRKTGHRNSAWIAWMAVAALLDSVGRSWNQDLLPQPAARNRRLPDPGADSRKPPRSEVLDVLRRRPRAACPVRPPAKLRRRRRRAPSISRRAARWFCRPATCSATRNKTYELWVIPAAGAPIPAGLFSPDASGTASVVLPSIPLGVPAKAFGITIEDAAGSSTPTAPIILSGAPPTAGE